MEKKLILLNEQKIKFKITAKDQDKNILESLFKVVVALVLNIILVLIKLEKDDVFLIKLLLINLLLI